MNCSVCNSKNNHIYIDYPCESRVLGDVLVPRVAVGECQGCGSQSLSSESVSEIHNHIDILEECAITSLPASDFITAGQAAAMLGVSKQAFSKNPKIKKGLVYNLAIGAKRYYLKSSVELFKRTGDGRFCLTQWQSSATGKRILLHNGTAKRKENAKVIVEDADSPNHSWNTSAAG